MIPKSLLSCFVLLLIYGNYQVSTYEYHIENAIEDINVFIPGSKLVFITALKVWSVYNEVSELVHPNMTVVNKHLKEMSAALNDIAEGIADMSEKLDGLSASQKETRDLINDKLIDVLPKYKRTQETIDRIKSNIHRMNYVFDEAFTIQQKGLNKYENKTLIDMVDSVIGSSTTSVRILLHEVFELVVDSDSKDKFLDRLAKKKVALSMMCERKESSHHEIKRLFQLVMVGEMRNLLMSQFAYSTQNYLNNKTNGYITESKQAIEQFAKRTTKMTLAFKNALTKSTRDFWSCDPEQHIEGSTFAKLSPVFQAYIMNEEDSAFSYYNKKHNKCSDKCEDHNETRDLCRSENCEKLEKKCSGLVRDCETSSKELKICKADKKSSRRYNALEVIDSEKNTRVYGNDKSCRDSRSLSLHTTLNLLYKCEFCICTCEDIDEKIDRYFSLKNVTSDVKNNFVVTAVKFAKKNNIFHIRIQQGKLLEDGYISKSTVGWKPIDNFTVADKTAILHKDYYKISWTQKTVNLDTLDAPNDNVLTGLRFKVAGSGMKLEINITPFDFATGKLKRNSSRWISSSESKRINVDLSKRDLGTSTTNNLYDYIGHTSSKSFKFTISSLESDVGQNVVPFIDLQKVESSPPVPLSGAGLILRNTKEAAGFLSFKLMTYNYAPHMKTK